MIMSPSIILGMRNVSEKYCRENKNTFFMYSNPPFFFSKIVQCVR